jgi:hypothetical protein
MSCRAYLLLFSLFTFLAQPVTAQSKEPYVSVSISKARFMVSGSVANEETKQAAVNVVTKQCGVADYSAVKIDPRVYQFKDYWSLELEDLLADCKLMTFGFIRYQRTTTSAARFPRLSRSVLNSELRFRDGTHHKFAEIMRDVTVVNFLEPWLGPSRQQIPELNKLALAHKDLRVVGISFDTEMTDDSSLWKFSDSMIQFPLARADKVLFGRFANIADYEVLPMTFVVVDGHVRRSFIGGGYKVDQELRDLVADILENRRKPK